MIVAYEDVKIGITAMGVILTHPFHVVHQDFQVHPYLNFLHQMLTLGPSTKYATELGTLLLHAFIDVIKPTQQKHHYLQTIAPPTTPLMSLGTPT